MGRIPFFSPFFLFLLAQPARVAQISPRGPTTCPGSTRARDPSGHLGPAEPHPSPALGASPLLDAAATLGWTSTRARPSPGEQPPPPLPDAAIRAACPTRGTDAEDGRRIPNPSPCPYKGRAPRAPLLLPNRCHRHPQQSRSPTSPSKPRTPSRRPLRLRSALVTSPKDLAEPRPRRDSRALASTRPRHRDAEPPRAPHPGAHNVTVLATTSLRSPSSATPFSVHGARVPQPRRCPRRVELRPRRRAGAQCPTDAKHRRAEPCPLRHLAGATDLSLDAAGALDAQPSSTAATSSPRRSATVTITTSPTSPHHTRNHDAALRPHRPCHRRQATQSAGLAPPLCRAPGSSRPPPLSSRSARSKAPKP